MVYLCYAVKNSQITTQDSHTYWGSLDPLLDSLLALRGPSGPVSQIVAVKKSTNNYSQIGIGQRWGCREPDLAKIGPNW